MKAIDSPLKWHGGKHYLAPKLWELCKDVPHVHRVEVFGGSLAFTLATEPEGYSEVVNDINGELMNFWRVMQQPKAFDLLQRRLQATPFSESEWMQATRRLRLSDVDIDQAAKFFVFVRQSMAGRMANFAPLSKRRVRRGMNEQASAWLTCVEGLPQVHERLKRVVVRDRPCFEVIGSEDSECTLFYLDPPYVHSTRATTKEYGSHEMSDVDHSALLTVLTEIKGKFLLSGYANPMYDEAALKAGWNRVDFDLPNNSSSAKSKERKIECVWKNF